MPGNITRESALSFDPLFFAGLVITALLSAAIGVLFLAGFSGNQPGRRRWAFLEGPDSAEFLFDGDLLVDATPTARSLLNVGSGRSPGAERARLMHYLDRHFPGIEERFAALPQEGTLVLSGPSDMMLVAEYRGGLARISLSDPDTVGGRSSPAGVLLHHRQQEFEDLQATVTRCPCPIWRENARGEVVWANATYLELATGCLEKGEDLSWPLPRLFDRSGEMEPGATVRCRLASPDDKSAEWFDIVGHDDPRGRIFYAMSAKAAVQAEQSLRAFMQTLTKTFAQLPTGLAIFDNARTLAMFNPALVDLSALPPDFLSTRPSLIAFFDALRDRSMIPEPRDYRSWRAQLTDLEQAASNGLYSEVWNLPGGQTYRVTGRPHPNGALALLFEDISSEVSQTRRYRADLELGQTVIDAMEDAIAVFSSAGVLVLSNAAYARLWDHDPAGGLGLEGQAGAVCDHWRSRTVPSALWDRAEDFIASIQPRKGWSDRTHLSDGRMISCRFTPLSGGATLAAFDLVGQTAEFARPPEHASAPDQVAAPRPPRKQRRSA